METKKKLYLIGANFADQAERERVVYNGRLRTDASVQGEAWIEPKGCVHRGMTMLGLLGGGGIEGNDPVVGYLPSGHHLKWIRLHTPCVRKSSNIFRDMTVFAPRSTDGEVNEDVLRASACEGSMWRLQDCLHDPARYKEEWGKLSLSELEDATGAHDGYPDVYEGLPSSTGEMRIDERHTDELWTRWPREVGRHLDQNWYGQAMRAHVVPVGRNDID